MDVSNRPLSDRWRARLQASPMASIRVLSDSTAWGRTRATRKREGAVVGRGLKRSACVAALALALPGPARSAGPEPAPNQPWMNPKLSPDRRADLVIGQMTLDEQIALLHGQFPTFMG